METVIEFIKKIAFENNRGEPFIPADYRGMKVESVKRVNLEGIKQLVIINEHIVYNETDNIVTIS